MLKARVITAMSLLLLVGLALFYWPPYGWQLFCTVLLACAAFEWTRLANYTTVRQNSYLVVVLISAYLLATWRDRQCSIMLYYGAAIFWGVVAPLWLKYKWPLAAKPWFAAFCGLLILLAAFDVLHQARQTLAMTQQLLSIVAGIWVADSVAYFVGRRFGKHKLASSISPGKSWEGVIGALVAVSIYAPIVGYAVFSVAQPLRIVLVIVVSWLLVAISIIGDLLESLFKRQIGLKDSSGLLPGHGGVLDRLDSVLALLPFAGMMLNLASLNVL